jgi:hypothetical protein
MGRVILKPIIQDFPFGVAFPTQPKGVAKAKRYLESTPYEVRHRWRMMKQYVPEDKFHVCF